MSLAERFKNNALEHDAIKEQKKKEKEEENVKMFFGIDDIWYNEVISYIERKSHFGVRDMRYGFRVPDNCLPKTCDLYMNKLVRRLKHDGFIVELAPLEDWTYVYRQYHISW